MMRQRNDNNEQWSQCWRHINLFWSISFPFHCCKHHIRRSFAGSLSVAQLIHLRAQRDSKRRKKWSSLAPVPLTIDYYKTCQLLETWASWTEENHRRHFESYCLLPIYYHSMLSSWFLYIYTFNFISLILGRFSQSLIHIGSLSPSLEMSALHHLIIISKSFNRLMFILHNLRAPINIQWWQSKKVLSRKSKQRRHIQGSVYIHRCGQTQLSALTSWTESTAGEACQEQDSENMSCQSRECPTICLLITRLTDRLCKFLLLVADLVACSYRELDLSFPCSTFLPRPLPGGCARRNKKPHELSN